MSNITPVRRVSIEKGDVGEYIFAAFRNANKIVKIFLDDIEQSNVITADADEGFVKRYSEKPDIEAGHWPLVIVRGNVRIEILDRENAKPREVKRT